MALQVIDLLHLKRYYILYYYPAAMTPEQQEKLEDYLSGLAELKNPSSFPIGAIIINESNRENTVTAIENLGVVVVNATDTHPSNSLKKLAGAVKDKNIVCFNLRQELPPEVANQISTLSNNQLDITLAGSDEEVHLSPVPSGGKLVLLMNKEAYENFPLSYVISSACAL